MTEKKVTAAASKKAAPENYSMQKNFCEEDCFGSKRRKCWFPCW